MCPKKEGLNSMQPVALKACRPLEVYHHENREWRKAVVGEKWTTMTTLHPLVQGFPHAGTASQKVPKVNEIHWRVDGADPVGRRTCFPEQQL